MNNDFYENLDINFEEAYKLCNKNFTHEELLKLLSNGNIPEKQISALYFDKISNKQDALALINNLTGCDGKIREAVAHRINYFITNFPECRVYFDDAKIFADATIDINGNICRAIVESTRTLIKNENFSKNYINYIIEFTFEALDELDKFIFRDKKYVINKQIFKLYWCLEAIKYFQEYIEEDVLLNILFLRVSMAI